MSDPADKEAEADAAEIFKQAAESPRRRPISRERIQAEFFDTGILRTRPGEFDSYPFGWCSSEVAQVAVNKEVRLFNGQTIGDRQKTNLEMPGCFVSDQTGIFRSARLLVVGSRLKREHYDAFCETQMILVVGSKHMICASLDPVLNSERTDEDSGLLLCLGQKYDIPVPARQNWYVSLLFSEAAIALLPRLELLRVSTEWTITRDIQ